MKNIKTIGLALLILLFIAPALGTALLSIADQSPNGENLWHLTWLVMSIYNLPFLVVSLATLLLGNSFSHKQKYNASNVLLLVSIVSSLAGIGLMILWVTTGASS
ncbi:hypothetical protein KA047_01650 [Candidatus Saccharibacteria bacterium]|jgi:cytochrome bd-type quinol oxidase subunit 2|nr:hypothetical protein [Candidatus Saccharibacteria bacterium]